MPRLGRLDPSPERRGSEPLGDGRESQMVVSRALSRELLQYHRQQLQAVSKAERWRDATDMGNLLDAESLQTLRLSQLSRGERIPCQRRAISQQLMNAGSLRSPA